MIEDYNNEKNSCIICKNESNNKMLCKKCYDRYKDIKENNFGNRKNPINLWFAKEKDITDNLIKLTAFLDTLKAQGKCGDTTIFIADLVEALDNKFKENYPHIRCKDRHLVRSMAEKMIDDYFFDNNIKHIYEKEIKEGDVIIHPDFYLPDICKEKVVLEHFGLNWESYKQNMELKRKFYKEHNYILIETNKEDIEKGIDDILENKLKELTN